MIDSRPIPDLSKTAFQLTANEFQRAINLIGEQTLAALGLTGADWKVDFEAGTVSRDIPVAD